MYISLFSAIQKTKISGKRSNEPSTSLTRANLILSVHINVLVVSKTERVFCDEIEEHVYVFIMSA